jgi:CRISPR/Cas system-associated exonuclease Cas4 (RecB family)
MAKGRLSTIRASEVGEFVFCARAWWLRRVAGLEPAGHERRAQGVVLHQEHGRLVASSRALLLVAVVLAIGAVVLLLFGR